MQQVKKPYISIKSNMSRYEQLNTILDEDYIREGKLRNLSSTGIPDHAGLRGTIWRLLLKYLPLDKSIWEHELTTHRKEYWERCQTYFTATDVSFKYVIEKDNNHESSDIISGLKNIDSNASISSQRIRHEYECDHPLSTCGSSEWFDRSNSVKLMNEIEKDVCRTHPDINFYHEYQSFGIENQKKLQRILFLFAKSHPEVSYVQGMNDICGTLLYVFGTDENQSMQKHAEADAYYCFEYLINVHQDMYMKSQDSKATGIYGRMNAVMELLCIHDLELYKHLEHQQLDVSFFNVRWLTTLLTREFNIADTILIWDCLFADTNQIEFLAYFSFTMIATDREFLLQNDFAHNLFHLQHYSQATITTTSSDADANLFGKSSSSSSNVDENSRRMVDSNGTTGGENLHLLLKKSFDWRNNDFMAAIQKREMIYNNNNNNNNSASNMSDHYNHPHNNENVTQYGYLVGNDDFISSMMYLDSFESNPHTSNTLDLIDNNSSTRVNYIKSFNKISISNNNNNNNNANDTTNSNEVIYSDWTTATTSSFSSVLADPLLFEVTRSAYNFIVSDILDMKLDSNINKIKEISNSDISNNTPAYEMNSVMTSTAAIETSTTTTIQNGIISDESFLCSSSSIRNNNNTKNNNDINSHIKSVDSGDIQSMIIPPVIQDVVVDFLSNAETQIRNFWRSIN